MRSRQALIILFLGCLLSYQGIAQADVQLPKHLPNKSLSELALWANDSAHVRIYVDPSIEGLIISSEQETTPSLLSVLTSSARKSNFHVHTDERGFSLPQTSGIHQVFVCALRSDKSVDVLIKDEFSTAEGHLEWKPDSFIKTGLSLDEAFINHSDLQWSYEGMGATHGFRHRKASSPAKFTDCPHSNCRLCSVNIRQPDA